MSKGKDFRGPRKRGFDDDGPMPYEPRPSRQPRSSFDRSFAPPPEFGAMPLPVVQLPLPLMPSSNGSNPTKALALLN